METDVLRLTRLIATEFLDDSESSRMNFGSTIAHDADDDLRRCMRSYISGENEDEGIWNSELTFCHPVFDQVLLRDFVHK